MEFIFFSVSENDKMDSTMKGLMGQYPPSRIFGLEPNLIICE